jgi:membrane dipeptidase
MVWKNERDLDMNRRGVLVAAAASAALAAVSRSAGAEGPVSAQAASLYARAMVFDANLSPPAQDTFPFPEAMLDMVRRAGVTAVKTSLAGTDANFEDTVAEIAFFGRIFEEYPDVFLQVRRHGDFERAKREKRLGVILSFESVAMLEGKVDRIETFRNLGVRVMQLSYNKASPFATGVLGDPNDGLTDLGHKAVESMNKLGVAIDISHANEKTSHDVLKASARPALITHAGCAVVHPHPRNKSDALLRAVADKGGVVGIFDLPYLAASPKQPDLDVYMAHMTHALEICGEDHVGVGSDSGLAPWDTSPKALAEFQKDEDHRHATGVAAPEEDRPMYVIGLNTPRRSEVIADALLKRGYKPRAVEKVLGLNFTDALGRIWQD